MMRKPEVVAASAAKVSFVSSLEGANNKINLNTTNRLHYLGANMAWAIIGPSDEEVSANRYAIVAGILKDLWYGDFTRENIRRAESIIDHLRKVRSEVFSGKMTASDAWKQAYEGRITKPESKTGSDLVSSIAALSSDDRAKILALLAGK